MTEKLNEGDTFPTMRLTLTDGRQVTLPDDLDKDFTVVLFFRGQW